MPFTNYFSARQEEPTKFKDFRYSKNKFGKGIDAVFGIKRLVGEKGGKTELQSIRFDKDTFSKEQAKEWLKKNNFKMVLEEVKEIIKEEVLNYRKKPTEHEVIKYTGSNGDDIEKWSKGKVKDAEDKLEIETLEGTMTASKGDWIIKGLKGEFWAIKPDIFELTYEPIPEDLEESDFSTTAPTSIETGQVPKYYTRIYKIIPKMNKKFNEQKINR